MKSGSPWVKVLVVEDSDDNRLIATTLLKRAGFEPAIARDGIEALEYLKTHAAPAAMILDIQMPRLDGWQLLAELSRLGSLAEIPVVICSCHDASVVTQALPSNVVAWIDKVEMVEHLVTAVRAAATRSTTSTFYTTLVSHRDVSAVTTCIARH